MCNTKKEKEIGGERGIRTPVQAFNPQLDFELVNVSILPIPVCSALALFYSQTQTIQQINKTYSDRFRSHLIGADGRELVSFLNTDPFLGAIGFCEYCHRPIYDSAISNHILFRCDKYEPKLMLERKITDGILPDPKF